MELTQLSFNVATEQLLAAKKAIDALSKAMGDFNKVSTADSKSAIAAAKAREADAKATVVLAKAKEAETKAALVAAKVNAENVKTKLLEEAATRKVIDSLEKKAAAESKATQAATKSADAARVSLSVLERQQSILDFMTQGFSKGQSSVLAYAKANGALTTELKQLEGVLQTQRKLIGNDPFDKSMSGLIALKNQYGEIREAIRQYNAESDLTRNQTRELTRDKERIIEKMKLEGKSFTDVKNAIRDYNQVYTEQAAKVNSLIKVEKDRERAARDHVNAIRNVQSAEERLFATVAHVNDGLSQNASLNERAALAVGSYERNLRLAGIAGEEAALRLQKFKAAQATITASENKRMGDYIARGVGVQVGDIGVSLASGQNPLIVMIQQLDQVRGLLQQAGRDGLDLKNVMNDAAAQIVRSFKDVGIAVGTFVGGALKSAGNAVAESFAAPFILLGDSVKALLTGDIAELDTAIKNFWSTLKNAIPVFAALAAVIAGAFLVAIVQVTKATNEMNSQILQFGASLGVTLPQAKELAASLSNSNIGASFATSLEAVGKFAKSGITDFDTLNAAVTTAVELQKNLGIEVEKTAERYAEVSKDPVKGLIELAKGTGLVTEAQIRHIKKLEETEGKAKAVKAAHDLVTASMEKLAKDAYDSLTPVEKLWLDIKKAVSDVWGEIQKIGDNVGVFNGLREVVAYLVYGFKSMFNGLKGIVALAYELSPFGDMQNVDNVASFVTDGQTKALADYNNTLKDINTTSKKTQEQLDAETKARQKNAIAASSLEKTLREEESAKKKANNEAAREAERIAKQAAKDEQSLIDLKNKYLGKIEQTTEAEQKYRSILESDAYAKYLPEKKMQIALEYAAAYAVEAEAKGIESLIEIYKSWKSINKGLESTSLDIANQNEEIKLQYELIGKTGDEYDKIKVQQEYRADLNKAELSFEKERLSIVENYLQQMENIKFVPGTVEFNAAVQENAESYKAAMKKAEDNTEQYRVLAANKGNLKIAQNYEKQWSRIQDGISNALYDSLFEGGEKGAKAIRKLIEDELKKEFILPAIKVLVNYATGGLGSLGNSALNSLLGTSGSNAGAGTNYLGMASNASSLYSSYNTAQLGYNWATGGMSTANAAGSLFANTTGTGLDGLLATNGAYGTAASSTGWASVMGEAMAGAWVLAIPSVGKMISDWGSRKQYEFEGLDVKGNYGSSGLDGQLGTRYHADGGAWQSADDRTLWMPLTDDKQKIVDGYFGNRLFNMGQTGVGSVQLGNSGSDPTSAIDLANLADLKNLRSAIFTDTSGADSAWAAGFAAASEEARGADDIGSYYVNNNNDRMYQPQNSWYDSAPALNLLGPKNYKTQPLTTDPAVLGGVEKVIEGIFTGLKSSFTALAVAFDDTEMQAKIQEFSMQVSATGQTIEVLLTSIATAGTKAMADAFLPSIETLRKAASADGQVAAETWEQAFQRVMVEVAGTARILDLMGTSLKEAFGAGNTNNLIKTIDSLSQLFGGIDALNTSFSAYYSNFYSAEEQRQQQMQDMQKVFASINLTMPETREGFRKLVDGLDLSTVGGQATFKALMDLQGGFATLVPVIADTSTAAKALADIIASQKNAVEDAYDALEKAVESEKELVQTRIDTLENQKSVLTSFFDSLAAKIKEVSKQSKALTLLSVNQSKAYLSDVIFAGNISDADKTSEAVDVLIEDFNKGTYKSLVEEEKTRANLLIGLTAVSNIAEDQLSETERMLQIERKQLTDLDNILVEQRKLVDAALGISTSILSMQEALGALGASILGLSASMINSGSKVQVAGAPAGGTIPIGTYSSGDNIQTIQDLYSVNLGRTGDAGGMAYWTEQFMQDGVIDAAERQTFAVAAMPEYLATHADGGRYAGGLALVGEEGPELINFSNPGMVYTASQTGNILGDSGAVEELRALREEVSMLRYEARATATNTAKAAKLLDRNTEQDSIKVTIVADQTV